MAHKPASRIITDLIANQSLRPIRFFRHPAGPLAIHLPPIVHSASVPANPQGGGYILNPGIPPPVVQPVPVYPQAIGPNTQFLGPQVAMPPQLDYNVPYNYPFYNFLPPGNVPLHAPAQDLHSYSSFVFIPFFDPGSL